MNYRNLIPLALPLIFGCVPITTSVTRTSVKEYPPRQADCDIQILSQPPTDRKFEEIAILSTIAIEQIYGKDLNSMLPNIKETACRLGADAVIIKNVEPGSRYEKSSGKAFTVAIKFIN